MEQRLLDYLAFPRARKVNYKFSLALKTVIASRYEEDLWICEGFMRRKSVDEWDGRRNYIMS